MTLAGFSLSLLAVHLAVASCSRRERSTLPPADAAPDSIVLSGAAVFIGAGDIAVCGTTGDEATAAIVDSVLRVDSAAKLETVVFGELFEIGVQFRFIHGILTNARL